MGWTFLSVDSLPAVGDVIWCRWPHYEAPGKPGPDARPVLVRKTDILEHHPSGLMIGMVHASYGTSQRLDEDRGLDLVIEPDERAREVGLHTSTRFSLNERNRKNLLWCSEFFLPPIYVKNVGVKIGSLNEAERNMVLQCLQNRKAGV